MKKLPIMTFIFLVALVSACSTATAPGGNTNSANNSANQANIPPEFQNKPVVPSGNSTPGIPDPNSANMNSMPKGATPTPGIPDPKNIGKTPVPKGATPTPGIPSQEEIRRQMNRTLNNANVSSKQAPKIDRDVERTINDTIKTVRKP